SVEIMDYVIRSSNHYTNPDYKTGYGIPDFELAFTMLEKEKARRFAEKVLNGGNIAVYPNPFANRAQIAIKPVNSGEFSIMLYDITGKLCYSSTEVLVGGEPGIVSIQRPGLARGVYILKVQNGQEKYVQKVLVH
ncbi:MAG: T9SS type A sorting domain-containing protein, partial [Chitinophagaceae bacterium]|nr:T9SS type A sorting domain-containing protein [Chitinophagaceae bacterium]